MFSMEATDGCSPKVSEQDLYRSIQGVLPRDCDTQQAADCIKKGMLRWTLHKKVQNNPENSLSLVRVLIKELEKAERRNARKCILPLLHTLMYAIIQTAYIPDELYKQVYDICKRLLTHPQPYCSVGLSCSRQIKMERSTPGVTYQRMLAAEQSLKNEYHPFQERVFVLADPDVFSGPVGQVLCSDIETPSSGEPLEPLDHMRCVVQHVLQAVLGAEHCHGRKLARALGDGFTASFSVCPELEMILGINPKGRPQQDVHDMGQDVESYFQEVMATVEQSVEEGSRGEGGALRGRLQQLYIEIVGEIDAAEPFSSGPLCDCPLPNPEMNFHMWTESFDIWRMLSKWFRSSSMSEPFSLSQEQDDLELGESLNDLLPADITRFSYMSNDSGIERDLTPGAEPTPSLLPSLESTSPSNSWENCKSEPESSRLSRSGGFRIKPSMKTSMVLLQESLEDHASTTGGGNGRRGERGGALQRRAGSMSSFPKQPRHFTARIVAIGDDRILGRLAKEYYFFRKREARRLFLTMKINLQFYYIPVHNTSSISPFKGNLLKASDPCSLGSYLSMVDPWYNSNIRSLGYMIPEMQQTNPGRSKDHFVSDVISYYIRMGQQPVYFTIYFVKITFTGDKRDPVEEVFLTHLEMEVPELSHIAALAKDKQKKNSAEAVGTVVSLNYRKVTLSGRDVDRGLSIRTSGVQIDAIPSSEAEDLNCLTMTFKESPAKNKHSNVESKIRTRNIRIRSIESRAFCVTLDKDPRRTYRDVQSIEVSPCLDPGYCVQKAVRSKYNLSEENDTGLSKYMNKGLPLPLNTFAGIIT